MRWAWLASQMSSRSRLRTRVASAAGTRSWPSASSAAFTASARRATSSASGTVGALGGRRVGAGGKLRDRARRIGGGHRRYLVSPLGRELLPVAGHERVALARHANHTIGHPDHVVAHDRARVGRRQRPGRHPVHLVHGLSRRGRAQRDRHGATQQTTGGGGASEAAEHAARVESHDDPVYLAPPPGIAARHASVSAPDSISTLRSSRPATTTSASVNAAGDMLEATAITRAPAARAAATPAGASSTTTQRLGATPSRSAATK